MACIPPLMVTIVFQIVPPLKVSGDWVSRPHISSILVFHVVNAFCRLSTTQLLSKLIHLQVIELCNRIGAAGLSAMADRLLVS